MTSTSLGGIDAAAARTVLSKAAAAVGAENAWQRLKARVAVDEEKLLPRQSRPADERSL